MSDESIILKKPRADARLKTLPEEMQMAIEAYARTRTLKNVLAWLVKQDIVCGLRCLSQFLYWRRLRSRPMVIRENEPRSKRKRR